ncbi:uncharacterized protein ARMOST_04272 [Armillaria ostoyae]|uniref:Uncharacterized protein n=1 Tax=Armillaria ostoyae TaxID=47428 RepID=A0A284QWW2_ARMOS|nr:uncharacterized protein ARMOST_04272 [Armillaria ostoyae]
MLTHKTFKGLCMLLEHILQSTMRLGYVSHEQEAPTIALPVSSPPVLLYSGACSPEIHCDEPKLLSAALGTSLVVKTWYLMQRRGLCGVTIPNTSSLQRLFLCPCFARCKTKRTEKGITKSKLFKVSFYTS